MPAMTREQRDYELLQLEFRHLAKRMAALEALMKEVLDEIRSLKRGA